MAGNYRKKEPSARLIELRRSGSSKTAASLAEYSVLFDAIDSGELGPHVKEALFGVCEGMTSSLQSHHAKVASESIEFSEADARQARLDQLLRRY